MLLSARHLGVLTGSWPRDAVDVLFLDPPYGAAELSAALTAAEPLVGPGTLLVVEHAKRDRAPEQHGALSSRERSHRGTVRLHFYSLRESLERRKSRGFRF